MEDFMLTHNICGETAALLYTTERDHIWDGEYEVAFSSNRLTIVCETCNVVIEPESK